jgi:hypothetical protein
MGLVPVMGCPWELMFTLDICDGRVQTIHPIANPHKLHHVHSP